MMLTKTEIKDGVAAASKLTASVRDIALRIGKMRGEFTLARDEQPKWHMDCFTINEYKPRADMDHLREMEVRTCWSAMVGDDEDRYRITRTIYFPIWYLTKGKWEAREGRKARNNKRWFARQHLEGLRAAVQRTRNEHEQMKVKLAETAALAREPEEEIDPT